LSLNDALPEAHVATGFIAFFYDRDLDAAVRAFERAIARDERYPEVYHWYGHLLLHRDRGRAVRMLERARDLAPTSLSINTCLGHNYAFAGETELAITQLEQTLEMDPAFPVARTYLGRVYMQAGRWAEAIEQFEAIGNGEAYRYTWGDLGCALGLAGRTGDARGSLRALQAQVESGVYAPHTAFAKIYAGLGEFEHAMVALRQAVEERELWLVMIPLEPHFQNMRDMPEFQLLAHQLGLTTARSQP
jgi:tetratricopeptide (TPR) repeat protein